MILAYLLRFAKPILVASSALVELDSGVVDFAKDPAAWGSLARSTTFITPLHRSICDLRHPFRIRWLYSIIPNIDHNASQCYLPQNPPPAPLAGVSFALRPLSVLLSLDSPCRRRPTRRNSIVTFDRSFPIPASNVMGPMRIPARPVYDWTSVRRRSKT